MQIVYSERKKSVSCAEYPREPERDPFSPPLTPQKDHMAVTMAPELGDLTNAGLKTFTARLRSESSLSCLSSPCAFSFILSLQGPETPKRDRKKTKEAYLA